MIVRFVTALARDASPLRLAIGLVLVIACLLLSAAVHLDIERALRPAGCTFLECLHGQRPELRHGGYSQGDLLDFMATIGSLRTTALWALLADLPVIASLTVALVTAASLATRGLPMAERSRNLLLFLPIAFAGVDLVEDTLFALLYGGVFDTSLLLPWISALKFGLVAASALSSLIYGIVRFALPPIE